MSDFTLSYHPPQAIDRSLLPSLAFIALLLLIFVGLDAYSPPLQVSQFGGVTEASHGDIVRQAAYLGVAALIGLTALQRYGMSALRAMPLSMGLLLAWCLASAMWAPESGIVLRRAGLEIIIIASLMLSVATIGPERAFTILRWVLAAVLVVNFVSIPLVATARHAAGEVDPALVGNWRGLYGHKNIAGAVCAITIILFLFTKNGWKNWIGIVIAGAAAVFLFFTHSKSSAGFLPVALLAGLIYRLGWRDGLSRAILAVLATLFVVGLIAFIALDIDALTQQLEDPREFTGRSAIWAAELRYIADHPLLGAGFGTFTDTKSQSPLHNYVSGSWVDAVSHGHNGYLQVFVTIGGIGFALTLLAVLVRPLQRFWALDWEENAFKPMLFAIFVFALLHNFMESDFLEGDGVTWSALLLVIAALKSP
ncbi:MAG TPA: O-antigen ligase family protein, partial [Rhizomicrobium sp.]|nr:O-antigen ligase family protein [Rhizomicrobium sp.]